jgi:DNA-binding NarL/FixJ family response regulator
MCPAAGSWASCGGLIVAGVCARQGGRGRTGAIVVTVGLAGLARMPVLDGIEATTRLLARTNSTRVVMLTTFDLHEYVVNAFRAGASG